MAHGLWAGPSALHAGRRAATRLSVLSVGLLFASLAGVLYWYGCSVYDPSLLLPGDAGGQDVVAQDVAPEAAPDVATACPEVFPPAKPAADDPSDAGDQTVTLALHTIDLGFGDEGGAPPTYGYDLDHVYTDCEGGVESCGAAVAGATHPDQVGGRDNSGGQLLYKLASFDPGLFNSSTISERLQNGTYSLLVQLLHYNGTADDTQVTAALYTSDGIQPDVDGAAPPAKWDGTDVWTIDSASVLFADASPVVGNFSDGAAYVADGIFVMHVNFPISLGTSATGGITVNLTGGVITGQLVPDGGGTYKLADGLIVGRWNVTGMLTAMQALSIAGTPLCQGTALYTNVKEQICQYADIMTSSTDDLMGKTCDALSLAFGFTADPANMGNVITTPAKMTSCEAGTPDSCSM